MRLSDREQVSLKTLSELVAESELYGYERQSEKDDAGVEVSIFTYSDWLS